MIKYFIRRTILRELDKESLDMVLQLYLKKFIVELLCYYYWAVVYIYPFIPLFIIDACEDIELSMTTQIIIITFILIYIAGFIVSIKLFRVAMFGFSEQLAKRIYFLVCTAKGNALSKGDFKSIKKINEKLYMFISTQMCKGYCYSICFEICKVLKKGSIEFIAVKEILTHDDKENNEKDFTMHVLYVNNGWAFDTNSSRQYPIEILHKIYKAKIYKSFSFDEIS